jgi:hypothetical protein
MSAATSLYSTIQQLTLTLGIVVGASVLEISANAHQRVVATVPDFHIAFLVVGAIALLSVPLCARLRADAGEALSGHHAKVD